MLGLVCADYVIELDRHALTLAKFAKTNPDCRPDKLCVYVGSTARTPEERFEHHKLGQKTNKYVMNFGVRLRPKSYKTIGRFDTRDEAEIAETRLAKRLRKRGYAASWSN